MKKPVLTCELFRQNRRRLAALLPPGSLAVVNANDVLPTNSDGVLRLVPNSDLFYLAGVEQEESLLLLFPDHPDPALREVLFLREPNPLLALWEGHKLGREEAVKASGVETIRWLDAFPALFHQLMSDAKQVYLNTNEHRRAVIDVENRDRRFVRDVQERFPLHRYERLAPLLHELRLVKGRQEIAQLRHACAITRAGFLRALKATRPGVNEAGIEAEFAHEFIRNHARFAYTPIVASGGNACVLHYIRNDQTCRKGDLLLLDVGACYGNYNADMTRTIPVSGRFNRRQKQVYRAVLRVLRAMVASCVPGRLHREWQQESEALMREELLGLGLLKPRDVRGSKGELAHKRYFPHGLGHPLGLDVHDVGSLHQPFQEGWVMTVEPGIYIPEEGIGVRLENDILVTREGPVDLMANIPIEPGEIESLMARRR